MFNLGLGNVPPRSSRVRFTTYRYVVLSHNFGMFEEDQARNGIAYGMGFGYLTNVLVGQRHVCMMFLNLGFQPSDKENLCICVKRLKHKGLNWFS